MSQFFSTQSGSAKNTQAFQYYMTLPQQGKVMAEYIWIGGSGNDLRSKTKTLNKPVKSVSDLPDWNFDGSSTGQAKGHYSEIWLHPVKFVKDPFRGAPNILVLCECLNAKTMKPIPTNRRSFASKIFKNEKVKSEEPWFGIEQEYTLFESDGVTPLGWPKNGFPAPQGPYYCGVGTRRAYGRQIVESHYRASLYAGLDISGINAEVMPGQWEYQVGPCIGIDSGDQLWLSRYILERIAEDFGVVVSFDAKPIKNGDWNGAGAHTNYSTNSMRTNPKTMECISLLNALSSTPQNLNDQLTLSKINDIKIKTENINNEENDLSSDESELSELSESSESSESSHSGDTIITDVNNKKLYGYEAILIAINKLSKNHLKHMNVYGKDNRSRLTGKYETAKYDQFSFGVANRGASIRIPRMSEINGFGYFEDRRPSASCDPYDVTSIIAETTLLS